jgi:hypothetical protein
LWKDATARDALLEGIEVAGELPTTERSPSAREDES